MVTNSTENELSVKSQLILFIEEGYRRPVHPVQTGARGGRDERTV
jgi:hypothetical protein